VGLVMVNGLPIAHHVWAGHLKDEQTVEGVIEDVQRRFSVERMIFVGDRGMVSTRTLSVIKRREQGYLVGLVRRQRPEVIDYIESATGPGTECAVGVGAAQKKAKTGVWEVAAAEPGVRVFVVHSDERQAYEQAMRERSMQRVRAKLEALRARVAKGQLKRPEKIGAAAAKILSRHHGHRYFDWRLSPQGQFEYFEHPAHLAREKQIEGKYVIQTEEQELDAVEAVKHYKELAEVERGVRRLKDVIRMRPIYHQTEPRVRAHIFVAALALLLERVLERKLTAAGVDLSVGDAWQALNTIGVVQFDVGGQKKIGITPGSARARQVLLALGVKRIELPSPVRNARVVTH